MDRLATHSVQPGLASFKLIRVVLWREEAISSDAFFVPNTEDRFGRNFRGIIFIRRIITRVRPSKKKLLDGFSSSPREISLTIEELINQTTQINISEEKGAG